MGVNRRDPEEFDTETYRRRLAEEYLGVKSTSEQFEEQRKRLREVLLEITQNEGDADSDGHVWLPVPDYLVKAERRQKVTFNADVAEQWLRDNGWWDEAKVEVPERVIPAYTTITEDALAAFLFRHRDNPSVPNKEPDGVYTRVDNYALKIEKDDIPYDDH